MRFQDFMDLYDNWNGITVVNDNNLNRIIRCQTSKLMFQKPDGQYYFSSLNDAEVVAFGFYDNELCVRIK